MVIDEVTDLIEMLGDWVWIVSGLRDYSQTDDAAIVVGGAATAAAVGVSASAASCAGAGALAGGGGGAC